MNRWSCFFLIVLRLAIGWHFLVEGYHKFHTHQIGETSTNKPWTGEPFFREGIGPAAQPLRDLLGDPDKTALARLKGDGQRLPAAVNAEWDEWYQRFVSHYGLSDDQKTTAQARLDGAKITVGAWLTIGQVEVKKFSQWGAVEAKKTMPQWLAEWEDKRREIADILAKKLPAFNDDVEGARLRTLKAEASRLRDDLLAALDEQTSSVKTALTELLTPDQKSKGEPKTDTKMRPIDYLDQVTMWTHMILGACLIVGLFTRTASLGLALFLLTVILTAPALPYAPSPPGAIGHYLYVNLYVIEMVALLLLASVPTGQWFGLDAVVHYFFGPRPRIVAAATPAVKPARRSGFDYPPPRRTRD